MRTKRTMHCAASGGEGGLWMRGMRMVRLLVDDAAADDVDDAGDGDAADYDSADGADDADADSASADD
eukprot:9477451-Pyramimonas_sp.AAC.1